MPTKTFTELVVWQKAHEFTLSIYKFTSTFPKSEIYCLTSQLLRAAVSIPANIAEGYKKTSDADKARLMNYAQGSLEECRYYLILASDLKYGDTQELMIKLEEVSKLLTAYIKAIRKK